MLPIKKLNINLHILHETGNSNYKGTLISQALRMENFFMHNKLVSTIFGKAKYIRNKQTVQVVFGDLNAYYTTIHNKFNGRKLGKTNQTNFFSVSI